MAMSACSRLLKDKGYTYDIPTGAASFMATLVPPVMAYETDWRLSTAAHKTPGVRRGRRESKVVSGTMVQESSPSDADDVPKKLVYIRRQAFRHEQLPLAIASQLGKSSVRCRLTVL